MCPAAIYFLVDEGVLDGNENERGDAQAHDDGGRGSDGNAMRMSVSNGLGSCADAQWFGSVRLLGRRRPAYRQFEEMSPDLMVYLEAEDRNDLGKMFLQEIE